MISDTALSAASAPPVEDHAGQTGGAAKTHSLGSGQHIETNDQLMGELGAMPLPDARCA
jgi:hypothetical protein